MSKVFIHATAEVSDKAILGGNTKVWNLAQIRENASIGDNTIISKNVYVDFDVKIGRNVKIQNLYLTSFSCVLCFLLILIRPIC